MKIFKERYSDEIPMIFKLLGMKRVCDSSLEFKWGYISFFSTPELCLDHTYEEGVPRICIWLLLFNLNIELPFIKQRYEDVNNSPRYGVQYHNKTLWWHWGLKYWSYYMPWDWDMVRHDLLNKDGSICCSFDDLEDRYNIDDEFKETYSYHYCLKSGETQTRTATIHGEEREWRCRWFKWLPYPRMIKRVIHIDFDDEVGERSGSWKGGVVGMSAEYRKGESMVAALRRCEREIKL